LNFDLSGLFCCDYVNVSEPLDSCLVEVLLAFDYSLQKVTDFLGFNFLSDYFILFGVSKSPPFTIFGVCMKVDSPGYSAGMIVIVVRIRGEI